ncbi:hypothetical protein J437_LFUL001971 [Ladona fulva]|uniref:C2H2-type domain-containing protein n=1 Tax=Ladona fulva TaxID=123851 RepID=A0A8K0NVS7_LADFU|nr:hypothetical protein J437_LFUL001971 [Ladona fulva]
MNDLCNDTKVRRISHISKGSCSIGNYETMLTDLAESSSKPVEDLLIEDEELKCSSCQQNFLRKLDFKNHLLGHLEGLPFRCIQCCYVCQSKHELVRHQRKRHGVYIDSASEKNSELSETQLIESFEDQEENEGIQSTVKLLFRVQNSIEADELGLSGLIKKPAKHSCRCHICLKRFSGSLYLSCHMGSHTGEKPYVCDICKKGFFLKDSLKKHSVCHSEERKYKCGECYKPFKRLSHARDHLKIHSQDFPYQCSKCGKSFRWQVSEEIRIFMSS